MSQQLLPLSYTGLFPQSLLLPIFNRISKIHLAISRRVPFGCILILLRMLLRLAPAHCSVVFFLPLLNCTSGVITKGYNGCFSSTSTHIYNGQYFLDRCPGTMDRLLPPLNPWASFLVACKLTISKIAIDLMYYA